MSAPNAAKRPRPDPAQIARTLAVIHAPKAIIELRALHTKGRKRTDAGYFDGEHRDQLVKEAIRLNSHGAAVYITLNQIDPQLLARCANRVQEFAQATATDSNVLRRQWLLIDMDPQRPKDTSATNEQLALALDRAGAVHKFLTQRGWPEPISADSGNGLHFLYRVDLPNDEPSRDLIKQCLEALAARFDDDAVKVDTSVHNAGRIVKLHGTVANKGDDVPEAPWRLSRLRTVPENPQSVPIELLEALAAEVRTEKPTAGASASGGNGRAWSESDVQSFLARGGIEWTGPQPHDGVTRWKLKACPFNPEHGYGEAAVFLRPDGRLGFECLHNSCQHRHWRDLRELVDGARALSVSRPGPQGPLGHSDELPPLEAYSDDPRANGHAPAAKGASWKAPTVVTYGEGFDPALIAHRRWLLGRRRAVGEVTVDAGPPGSNKSTLILTDAVSIVTGRGILADDVCETGGVLYLAGEDARRDVEARLAGILEYHHIPASDLKDRLHVVYLGEIDVSTYTLAQMMQDVAVLNVQMFDWLRTYPDVIAIFLDPIAAWHRLMENSNEALQILCSALRGLAVAGQRHVGFDHHVNKLSMTDPEAHVGNLASLRGAGAIGAAARWAFTMAKLKTETAATFGVPEAERPRYRRLDPLKASYGPDDDQTRLLRIESVRISNGESVGVLVEVDMQRTREEAQKRKVSDEEARRRTFAAALAEMIGEQGPSSIRSTALWLLSRYPNLPVLCSAKGKTLGDTTIRNKLPGLIGPGLPVLHAGRSERIVIRSTEGKRGAEEIAFASTTITGQGTGQ